MIRQRFLLKASPAHAGFAFFTILFILALLLTLTWLVYAPGFSGSLHLDDHANLGGLATADNPLKRIDFIFSGQAGPIGRPLALATFAAQQEHWRNNLPVLLQTNVALHLLTGIAVFMLSLALARSQRLDRFGIAFVALLTTALWLFSPLLASTQLMVVQRMTTLAGLFVFGGLAAFTWGRLVVAHRPRTGAWLMLGGLTLGTLLATLAKENGALLPLLALVIDRTLLRDLPPIPSRLLRRAVLALLWLTSLALLAYLLTHAPNLANDGWRAFTPLERLMTQPVILWDYVFNLILPRSSEVTPFTDDQTVVLAPLDSRFLLSLAAWVGLLALSYRLRHRHAALSFGVLFFLVGHLLESTILYLELYFPHRNYVPAFGLYFTIAYLICVPGRTLHRLLPVGGALYALTFLGVLWVTTSLWGQPRVAAEIWAVRQPDSDRALHYLANAYVEEGDHATATRVLDQLAARDPSGLYAVQSLLLCSFTPEEKNRRVEQILATVGDAPRINGLGESVHLLANRIAEGACEVVSIADVERIAMTLLDNPSYRHQHGVRAKLHNALAVLADTRGDETAMLERLHEVYEVSGHLDLGLTRAGVLASRFEFDAAIAYLKQLLHDAPDHPIRGWVWKERIQGWIDIMESEKALFEETVRQGLSLETFTGRTLRDMP